MKDSILKELVKSMALILECPICAEVSYAPLDNNFTCPCGRELYAYVKKAGDEAECHFIKYDGKAPGITLCSDYFMGSMRCVDADV